MLIQRPQTSSMMITILFAILNTGTAFAITCWWGPDAAVDGSGGTLHCPHPPSMSDCTMVYDSDPEITEFSACNVSPATIWPAGPCGDDKFSIQLDYGTGHMDYCCTQANDTKAILNYCTSHMQNQCPTGLC
jgi:hypothetical protein